MLANGEAQHLVEQFLLARVKPATSGEGESLEWCGRGTIMITLRIKADVPNHRQVMVTLPPEVPTGPAELIVTVDSRAAGREQMRSAALDQFLALARASTFCSAGPYPTRDELHARP